MNQPPPYSTRHDSGTSWIVVVVAIVGGLIVVVGILAVLAIAGVRRYIGAAKTAEARNDVNQIGRDAVSAYDGEDVMTGVVSHQLCSSATQPVPKKDRSVSGVKYQSALSDWTVDAPSGGFSCLKFEMDDPQYYQVNYTRMGTGSKVGDSFVAEARGDLDGDGVFSSFKLGGHIIGGDMVLLDTSVKETNPDE